MATINSLTTLNIPTGSENVVIQNNDNNYKMAYKPILSVAIDFSGQTITTMPAAIDATLDEIRTRFGDIYGYHIQAYVSIPNWSNGITITIDNLKAGNYVNSFGTAYSQSHGVHAFNRWDTILGAAGTLRTSELGSNLA